MRTGSSGFACEMSANRIKFKHISWPKGPHWLTLCDSFLSLCIRLSSYTSATSHYEFVAASGSWRLSSFWNCFFPAAAMVTLSQHTHFISKVVSSQRYPLPNLAKHHPPSALPQSLGLGEFPFVALVRTMLSSLHYGWAYHPVSCCYLFHTHNSSRSTDDRDFV